MIQAQAHVQLVSAMVDDGLDPQAALDRPRFRVDGEAVRLEEGLWEHEPDLQRLGYQTVRETDTSALRRGSGDPGGRRRPGRRLRPAQGRLRRRDLAETCPNPTRPVPGTGRVLSTTKRLDAAARCPEWPRPVPGTECVRSGHARESEPGREALAVRRALEPEDRRRAERRLRQGRQVRGRVRLAPPRRRGRALPRRLRAG